ncbi:hypothetical protein [Sinomonas soli]
MPSTVRPRRLAAISSAALSAAALSLALSGCASMASTAAPAPSQPAPSATASPSRLPPSAGTSSSTSTAARPALATYKLPGGAVSFDYPRRWTVELFHAASASVPTATATLQDADGRKMATVSIAAIGDVVGHAGPRTVFESVAVPGLAGLPGAPAHASFYRVGADGGAQFALELTAGAVTPGENAPGSAPEGLVRTRDGILAAAAVWDSRAPFASDEAARAWYSSAEGRAVRDVLLSVRAK